MGAPGRTPGIKLKSLNWTKIENRKINETIWKEIKVDEVNEVLDNDWKSKVETIFSDKVGMSKQEKKNEKAKQKGIKKWGNKNKIIINNN